MEWLFGLALYALGCAAALGLVGWTRRSWGHPMYLGPDEFFPCLFWPVTLPFYLGWCLRDLRSR